jgi:hypothetical protein
VRAIAQVHGLQVGADGLLQVAGVVRAIAEAVQRGFGRAIDVRVLPPQPAGKDLTAPPAADGHGDSGRPPATEGRDPWLPHDLPEAEAIPVALTINELLTNAIKHGRVALHEDGPGVRVSLQALGPAVCIRVSSVAQLAPGFDLAHVRGGVSGLGLVRALLPRRSASFTLTQQGDAVVAEVRLLPPSVTLPDHSAAPPSAAAPLG